MERKKSKHSASFPKTLDMAPFMMSRGEGPSSGIHASADNVYELRGVLLHKGPSAYHGHYEAQVFDETKKSWYQFNDENVTRIKALGDKSRIKPIVVGDDDDPNEKIEKIERMLERDAGLKVETKG
ncbi:hypothetical protein H0H87_002892 [Tephrocybe sp. NHM501043]|nr:hypothetical protein H0H87_002892 [Tephrocybe sp. NHM501043]